AAGAAVEQRRAHRHRLHAVPLLGRVLVPARPVQRAGPVAPAVERRVRRLPWPRRELPVVPVHLRAAGRLGHQRNHHQPQPQPPHHRLLYIYLLRLLLFFTC
uniref:Uncharacterized protein n=1 Tax=Oryza brachyantha TaxID=4533 RepID=J3MVC5_ORYBR